MDTNGLIRLSVMVCALNGWVGNPAWIIDSGNDYPRLVWEGTPGEPIPDPNEGG